MPVVCSRFVIAIGLTSIAVEASAIDRPIFIGNSSN